MNVVNMMATPAAPVTPGAVSLPSQEYAGVGNLFAMQIGSALQNVQQADLLQLLPGDLSKEDGERLEDLLAMLQQLLDSGVFQLRELAPRLEEKLAELEQVSVQLPTGGSGGLSPEDRQRLIATFTQQGLSQEMATKTVDLLAQFSQAGETVNQPKWQKAARQVQDVLASLGVKPQESKSTSTAERKPFWHAHTPAVTEYRQKPNAPMSATFDQNAPAVQTLRVNLALSRYQTEAGISTRITPVSVESINQGSGQSDRPTTIEGATLPVQAPAVPVSALHTTGTILQTVAGEGQFVQGDRFAQQVSELFVKQMKIGKINGVSEAKLILYPQSLGQVDVKITSHNGVITAHFSAETANGKELLDNQLPQLRAALTQQGLQVDRLEVTQQQTQQFSFQQQREQSRQQQNGNRQQRDKQDEQKEFSLEKLVDRTEPISALWARLKNAAGVEYTA